MPLADPLRHPRPRRSTSINSVLSPKATAPPLPQITPFSFTGWQWWGHRNSLSSHLPSSRSAPGAAARAEHDTGPFSSPGSRCCPCPRYQARTRNNDKRAADTNTELQRLEEGLHRPLPRHSTRTNTGQDPCSWPDLLPCHPLGPSYSWALLTWGWGYPGPPGFLEGQAHCPGAGHGNEAGAFAAGDCQGRGWCVCPRESVGKGVSLT